MIDLDAVSAALAQPTAHAAAAPTAPPVAKPATSGHVIPDTPIPFGPLRPANADVKLSVAQLKSRGVLIRQMGSYGLPDCLRITVGTAEECGMVIEALADFMKQARG